MIEVNNMLLQLGQQHLMTGIEHLSSAELQVFFNQLKKFNLALLKQQRELLGMQNPEIIQEVTLPKFSRCGNAQDQVLGEELICQKKVGCLILAGGQGTRLGFHGPKGTFPILNEKSLFQLFCERARGPVCIMTSPYNHSQTLEFFQKNHHFGLPPSQFFFFCQDMLPYLDDQGNWLLEKPGLIAEGPDGNGHALNLFFESGIWQKWIDCGIEYLNVIFVDNALADPFDAEFVGLTAQKAVDVAIKAIDRLNSDSTMGALIEKAGRLKVVEYSEIPKEGLHSSLSHTGMFCISMPFIGHFCQELRAKLPLHLARKRANVLLEENAAVWKCERYLFDLLDYVRSSAVFVCPRQQIYAPLKNATGEKSLKTVREALVNFTL